MNLVTLILLSAVAGALYSVVMFGPLYIDHLDMKEAVTAAYNLAAKNTSDARLRSEIRERTKDMAQHWAKDEYGNDVLKPGLGLTDDQIIIERSEVTGNLRIEVVYERHVQLKPSDYIHTLHFSAVREGNPNL